MEHSTRSVETLSAQPGTVQVEDHVVVEETDIVPGQHPEPHLRYEGQTSYLERYLRCVRCDIEVLRAHDFPNECDPPKFDHGTRVIDEQNPGSQAIVINPDLGQANFHRVDGEQTVAEYEGNESYPDDDRVTEIAFVDSLDASVPGWREWDPEELGSALRQYSERYGVEELRTYSYPESRLKLSDEVEEQGRDGQLAMAGGAP